MNPGGAAQTFSIGPSAGTSGASFSAIAIGLVRMGLASFNGSEQAKSPCSGFWGRSIGISSTVTGGEEVPALGIL